jgi:hypothetical protein
MFSNAFPLAIRFQLEADETTNFMLVVFQFRPNEAQVEKLGETTNFMLVVFQFRPNQDSPTHRISGARRL